MESPRMQVCCLADDNNGGLLVGTLIDITESGIPFCCRKHPDCCATSNTNVNGKVPTACRYLSPI